MLKCDIAKACDSNTRIIHILYSYYKIISHFSEHHTVKNCDLYTDRQSHNQHTDREDPCVDCCDPRTDHKPDRDLCADRSNPHKDHRVLCVEYTSDDLYTDRCDLCVWITIFFTV